MDVFAEYIAKYPKLVIIVVILSLLISGYYAAQVKIGVDTGNFELKNEEYQTYKKIVQKFGSEADDVIIVAVSKDGYILNREDMQSILRLEMAISNSTESEYNESLVDYVLEGIHLIKFLSSLPDLNLSMNPAAFNDTHRLISAIHNYQFVEHHANETIKNNTYQIYILFPKYAGYMMNPNGTGNGSNAQNFTYPSIIKHAKHRKTVYNATNMLIDEIEIYQNLSQYAGAPAPELELNIPENYSARFLNESIASVDFNITLAKAMMEHYNSTYLEWYAYNTSFNLALSLLYSGYRQLALSVYKFDRTTIINATENYERDHENWSAYDTTLLKFENSTAGVQQVINETEFMKNRSFGSTRDFLGDYLSRLKDYANGTLSRNEIMNWTWRARNMSAMILQYIKYARSMDSDAIPIINSTISQVENHTGYTEALKLKDVARNNMQKTANRIMLTYGEMMLLEKVRDILSNLQSIILSDESPVVKQDSWELIRFAGGLDSMPMAIGPMYDALRGYRDTIFTDFFANTSSIMWNYLTIEPFDMNYTEPDMNYNYSYTRQDMLNDTVKMNQTEIDDGIAEIRSFENESVESVVSNYTTKLINMSGNLTRLRRQITFIKNSYATLGEVSNNLTALLNNITDMTANASLMLKNATNQTYSLRIIEDFFSMRDMYFGTLLSRDSLSTLLIIGLTHSKYEMPIYNITKKMPQKPVGFHTLSSKVLVREIEETATYDMKTLLPISLIVLIALLAITYRSVKAMILSLMAVMVAMVWMFAFLVLMGWKLDPILLAVPVMIIGIGIDDGIYVTLRYMEERKFKSPTKATTMTVASVGGALILTTLTSMVGFMSNSISSMVDIQRFGILAAAGLFFSFISMNTFLPAMNMVFDTRGKIKNVAFKPARVGAEAAVRVPYLVIAIVLIFSVMGVAAFTHLNTEFTLRDLAPADSEIVTYYHYYENNFNASVEYSYIYMEGNLTNPAVLEAMHEVEKNIEDDTTVVHQYPVISPLSIMEKYAHARRGEYFYNAAFIKLFHESDTNHDGIPDKNISMLYHMLQPEISRVLNGNTAIMIIRTNSEDLKKVDTLLKELNDDVTPLKKYVNVRIAGDALVGKASIDEINENQMRSLFLSITAAIIMLIVLFFTTKRSITLGIIAAVPIMVVVTWNWLLMYILGISLNVMTNTIASLCVGLGVDYGIHITHRFVEESHRFHDLKKALFIATERLGRGMVSAATTTIAAIGILVFSTIPPLGSFALILSFSIFFAFLAAILFLPTLLMMWASYRRKHGYDEVHEEVKNAIKNRDARALCLYHVNREACGEYVYSLVKNGRIREAREIIEKLKDEGMDFTYLLRGGEERPPFE